MRFTTSSGRPLPQLCLLALVELLAMSLWFSATAVAPVIAQRWGLSDGSATWLTISVQLGFVAGALVSAVFNLSERIAPPLLMAGCAIVGAAANLAIGLSITDAFGRTNLGFATVIALRFLTGAMLAGVYPTGMKIMASWFVSGRGLAIGTLVGALTIGSAMPHLINAFPFDDWSARAFGGLAAWRLVMVSRLGQRRRSRRRFPRCLCEWGRTCRPRPALILDILPGCGASRPSGGRILATWATCSSCMRCGPGPHGCFSPVTSKPDWPIFSARLAGFATVAIGAVGCVLAGFMADRAGRCWTTIVSLAISGGCALVAGGLFHQPGLLTVVCLLWGLSVVADSAQFSAAVSELCDPRFVGTALTIQTCAGFLLTTLTIRAVPELQQMTADSSNQGWNWALAMLAVGPVFGIYHMARLWRMDAASRMSNGNR